MSDRLKGVRVLVVGAHPDDPDINFGGSAVRFVREGATVHFLSVCNGSKGHLTMSEADLAARRFGEMQRSAAILGVEKYETLGCPDCELEVTMAWKKTVTKVIREFAPHLVFTHRTCDYHADHRACGQIMMDITYFLKVPHWCPNVAEPEVAPAVFFLRDKFSSPREMRPDVAVDVTAVQDVLADALACHESQMFEWLPREYPGATEDNPGASGSVEAKRAYVKKYWFARKLLDAKRFNLPFVYPEVFEMSEYGRQLSSDEIIAMFPEGSIVGRREASGWR